MIACLAALAGLARAQIVDISGVWQGYFNRSGLTSADEIYEVAVDPKRNTTIDFTITMVLSSHPSWTIGEGRINLTDQTAIARFDSGAELVGHLRCYTPPAETPSVQGKHQAWNPIPAQQTSSIDGCQPNPARYPSARWVLDWNNTSVFQKAEQVSEVTVVAMNHLDVGYNGISPQIGFINNIMNKYFHIYFPRAIAIARELEALGGPEQLVYTTHPWLVQLYLHCPPNLELANGTVLQCPTTEERQSFLDAVSKGWITWHAGPFNLQPENAADPDLFERFVDIAFQLDDECDQPHKTVLSQRDVPGMTRAVLPSLVSRNVTGVSVGVNNGTPPPAVARRFQAFLWAQPASYAAGEHRDWSPSQHASASPASVLATWHPGGYPNNPGPDPTNPGGMGRGDCVVPRGFGKALCFAFRTDNHGPPESVDEVLGQFEIARAQFPGAAVVAGTFDQYFGELRQWFNNQTAALRAAGGHLEGYMPLPVVTDEIGDTWLEGVSSDPSKMAAYRRFVLLRAECVNHGGCDPATPAMVNATFFLAKIPEHTWGLPSLNDAVSWTNEALEEVLESGVASFQNAINAWAEQRQFLWLAQQALDASPDGTPEKNLAAQARVALQATIGGDGTPGSTVRIPPRVPVPNPQSDSRYSPVAIGGPVALNCPGSPASLVVDGKTGAVINLTVAGLPGSDYASAGAPLGLLQYETYDANETDAVGKQYQYGFGGLFDKPNVTVNAHPKAQTLYPSAQQLWVAESGGLCSVVAKISFPTEAVAYYGAPAVTYLNYTVEQALGGSTAGDESRQTSGAAIVGVVLTLLNATRTRLSQSMQVLFHSPPHPAATGGSWTLDKLGQPIDPMSVMLNGSQWQHAVFSGAVFGQHLSPDDSDALLGWKGATPSLARERLQALKSKSAREAAAMTQSAGEPVTSSSVFVISRDAPMAFPYTASHGPTPFPVPLSPIQDPLVGMGFSLYNTVYDTNYILFGQSENMAFEFEIDVAGSTVAT